MTENEIMEALADLANKTPIAFEAINLINRYKAEVERLKEERKTQKVISKHQKHVKTPKAEILKVSVERLKALSKKYCGEINEEDIDDIANEMVGEINGC